MTFVDLPPTYSSVSYPYGATQLKPSQMRDSLLTIASQHPGDMQAALRAAREVLLQQRANLFEYPQIMSDALRGTLFDTPEAGRVAEQLQGDASSEKEEMFWFLFAAITSDSETVLEQFRNPTSRRGMWPEVWHLNRHQPQETLQEFRDLYDSLSAHNPLARNPSFRLEWRLEGDLVWSGQNTRVTDMVSRSALTDLGLLRAFCGGSARRWSLDLKWNPYMSRELLFQAVTHLQDEQVLLGALRRHAGTLLSVDERVRLYWCLHEQLMRRGESANDAHTALLTEKDRYGHLTEWMPQHEGVASRFKEVLLVAELTERESSIPSLMELATDAVARMQSV